MNYHKKMGSIFGSPQSGKTNSSSANQIVATNTTTATAPAASTGCCLGINGCSSSESVNVVPMSQHPTISKLEQQLNGWYIHPEEIEFEEKIGQGSTAHIYKGTWHGLEVAVKCLYPDFFETNDNGIAFFAQELETLGRQRHQYILQLMGACPDPPNYAWVVTEFMNTSRPWK
ncbi:hypothetical protein C1H46_039375 [Malus baccata]|uniref:Protein kinase domain-containing protein n=1 Tax=Malus baccata TaxID=106549 RepID=A0A540KLL7_MALBA|nr:hypothetical protein C1H46_039375 [Malus baccata]